METAIGIRYFTFSADSRFALNGIKIKFQYVNEHSDLGALGAALNNRVLERKLETLKDKVVMPPAKLLLLSASSFSNRQGKPGDSLFQPNLKVYLEKK